MAIAIFLPQPLGLVVFCVALLILILVHADYSSYIELEDGGLTFRRGFARPVSIPREDIDCIELAWLPRVQQGIVTHGANAHIGIRLLDTSRLYYQEMSYRNFKEFGFHLFLTPSYGADIHEMNLLTARWWKRKEDGEPGATDNPDDAQRLREVH